VPIIVWGSHLVIKLVDRFPSVILIGGAVLAWTAYTMIIREPMLETWLQNHVATKMVIAILIFSVAMSPWIAARLTERLKPITILLPALMVWLLGVEVVGTLLHTDLTYLPADETSEQVLNAVRWVGWIPLAVGFLWIREQRLAKASQAASA
jgi:hypothetical protein